MVKDWFVADMEWFVTRVYR